MDGQNTLEQNTQATDATAENQAQASKTYTQEEFDKHMSGMRKAIESKFEKQFAELGDLNELRQLKTQAETAKEAEAIKRGEFEKILQEKHAKWETEIQKRDQTIKEYKVNTPLLEAAAKHRAVAPEQVRQLLNSQVRLNADGEVEIVDSSGTVRYGDAGKPVSVDELVKEFLSANPHFVTSGPATTNTRSNDGARVTGEFDVSKLDFKNAKHREMYKEAKSKGLI